MNNQQKSSFSFTDFFIERPVFSWVINIIIMLLGVSAYMQLSTRQYPLIEKPSITVTTTYNASGPVIEQQITRPLEDGLSSLQGLENMVSETIKDESRIFLTFKNRPIDNAAADVRDMVSRVRNNNENSEFPESARIEVLKGNSHNPAVMYITVSGQSSSLSDLYYYAENVLKSSIESVSGVATAEISGGSQLGMKIVLDPVKMQSYLVNARDVDRALIEQNFERSAGRIREATREFVLTAQAKLSTPEDFAKVIVSRRDGKFVRLSDISTSIKMEPREAYESIRYNGKDVILILVRAQSDANTLAMSEEIATKIKDIEKRLPKGSSINIAIDNTVFVKENIWKVYQTFFEAVFLVIAVVLLFLRSWRASLIPLITIPISILGSFFLMYCLGFTINVLSLLALVLGIGLVVDDAIIVMENIYRYIEQGKSPLESAFLGTREIQFSVIAMTLTLAAVYAPISMAPGIIGKVFREFALTLASAVLVSGVTALTLSPVMCSRLLVAHAPHGPSSSSSSSWIARIGERFEQWLGRIEHSYGLLLSRWLSRKLMIIMVGFSFSIASMWVGWVGLPKELAPTMDEGMISGVLLSPPSSNLGYLQDHAIELDKKINAHPEITNVLMHLDSNGQSSVSAMLLPWKKRSKHVNQVVKDLSASTSKVMGISCWMYPLKTSILPSSKNEFPLSFELLTLKSASDLKKIGGRIKLLLREFPGIEAVDFRETAQLDEYTVQINRERAAQLDISLDDIAWTLKTLVKGERAGSFEKDGRLYPVWFEIANQYRSKPEELSAIFLKGKGEDNRYEAMVPLGELCSYKVEKGESSISHTNKNRSYDIGARVKDGYDIVERYEAFIKFLESKKILGSEYYVSPSGEIKNYYKEQGTIYIVFGLAMAFIFLVMAAQFESLRDPFIILISVPLAVGGALLSLFLLRNGSINVYSQIGCITLVGLITKHGILLVDFANQLKAQGYSVMQAIVQSCRLRLRPILMTTFAMVLGAVPLAFGGGAGSEARNQIGIVIVGGMTIGTIFTLFVIPAMYVLLSRDTTKELSKH